MAKTAFISNASEDETVANTICAYLERNAVSCWIAPRDVRPGSEYAAEIIDGIKTSSVFVLVLSEHANTSEFVKREVDRAVSKSKPIFPVRVREVIPSKSLELFISFSSRAAHRSRPVPGCVQATWASTGSCRRRSPEGGTITAVRGDGRALHAGSTRNGVSSGDFGAFPSSVTFR